MNKRIFPSKRGVSRWEGKELSFSNSGLRSDVERRRAETRDEVPVISSRARDSCKVESRGVRGVVYYLRVCHEAKVRTKDAPGGIDSRRIRKLKRLERQLAAFSPACSV